MGIVFFVQKQCVKKKIKQHFVYILSSWGQQNDIQYYDSIKKPINSDFYLEFKVI